MDELIGWVLEALGELIGEAIIIEITKRLESIGEEQEEESNENEKVNRKSYRNSNDNGNGKRRKR